MLFQTYGDRRNPAVLFFHAMGVTGASSEPIARYLQDRYFFAVLSISNSFILSNSFAFVKNFFQLFSKSSGEGGI